MLVQRTLNGSGDEHFYFFCRGRQNGGGCTSRHLNFMDVEDLVIDHYDTIRLRPEFITMVRDAIDEAIEEKSAAHIRGWLELLSNLKRLYADAPDDLRRELNQAFFKRIYVGDEGRTLSEPAEQVLLSWRHSVPGSSTWKSPCRTRRLM
jgi:hypothetical protein